MQATVKKKPTAPRHYRCRWGWTLGPILWWRRCDDTDDTLLALGDCDGDGVPTADDCDDTDDTLLALGDCDGDGVPTADDCDDTDDTMPNDDADCDGVLTADDLDDTDPAVGIEWRSVSAAWNHTCGVDSSGSVQCWGLDHYGQSSPPDGTFQSVSAGEDTTCGVDSSGSVQCWGFDEFGQASPPDGTFQSVTGGCFI